jgi:hypothetical protein
MALLKLHVFQGCISKHHKVVLTAQNLLHLSCSDLYVKEMKKYETGVPSSDGTKLNFVKIGHFVQKLLVLTCADLRCLPPTPSKEIQLRTQCNRNVTCFYTVHNSMFWGTPIAMRNTKCPLSWIRLTVFLYAWNDLRTAGQIFIKFGITKFRENFRNHFNFHQVFLLYLNKYSSENRYIVQIFIFMNEPYPPEHDHGQGKEQCTVL